jgi:F-type H+-transporting ATPase subunit b
VESVFAILKIPDLLGHLVAFIILFWVLKRFLWGFILKTVDERQESIELAYTEVEKQQADAGRLSAQLSARLAAIEEEKRKALEDAAQQGKTLAEEIRRAAEAQRERILEKARADIAMERDKLRVDMNNYAADLSVGIAEKLLQKQLDHDEQRRLARTLMADL